MKQVMNRSASDNTYLHKDFHGALSTALTYLQDRYGDQSVREYLHQFAAAFYSALTADINQRGLVALQEHFERIYQIEGGKVDTKLSDDEMILDVDACPAVMHLRQQGQPVAPLFYETTKTVNETICEGTPFAAELVDYDEATGRSQVRFARRTA